ncbi:MAG: ATP-binding cassette domain-containing protein [Actinomycetota bacterium]|nr:ATP-binding cassette domain-containing protein [Actinomycetota bacterium]
MILLDAVAVSMSRPDRPLFTDVSVTVSTGDRIGVVGINGTGKSTLLRVIAGRARSESGEVRLGRGVRISMLDQDAPLPPGRVLEAVLESSTGRAEAWEAEAALTRFGMGHAFDRDTAGLSGGEAKRVGLAKALVASSDLLILDEPTNHLDLDGIEWLEQHLTSYRGGLLLVTHDRHLLDKLTTRMLELDRGRAHVHDGHYDSYLDAMASRAEQAADAEAIRRNLARSELAWLRRGPPSRATGSRRPRHSSTRKPKGRLVRPNSISSSPRHGWAMS